MFGKEKSTWEELSGIFTAQEIYQQPATWAKTIAQIKNEKEALKKFMEPVIIKCSIHIKKITIHILIIASF